MAYPTNKLRISEAAVRLHNYIINMKSVLAKARIDANAGSFDRIVQLPDNITKVTDYIDSIIGIGSDDLIKGALDELLGDSVVISDVVSFVNALKDIRTTIVANAAIFPMSFNVVSGKTEFITPITTSQLAAINNKVDSSLAFLG